MEKIGEGCDRHFTKEEIKIANNVRENVQFPTNK